MLREERKNDNSRQPVFFTPLDPFGNNPDEEKTHDDYTIPHKVHYKTYWKHNQVAVYWIKLSRAQDQGLQFWQTKSFANITYDIVPGDCIHRVISQNGGRVLFGRLATPSSQGYAQKPLACAAAAAAAQSQGRRDLGMQSRNAG